MTDRPIIFSGPMVRALLDGRKTQTRRVLKGEPPKCPPTCHGTMPCRICGVDPRYAVGDRLWVRENHALVGGGDPGIPIYAANWREDAQARGFDNIPEKAPRWTPSIHMPRWASRLTLIVEAVKVERLTDISEADAIAEGVYRAPGGWWSAAEGQAGNTPEAAFAALWQSINGDGAWTANPWVVAVTFRVVLANIDAVPA